MGNQSDSEIDVPALIVRRRRHVSHIPERESVRLDAVGGRESSGDDSGAQQRWRVPEEDCERERSEEDEESRSASDSLSEIEGVFEENGNGPDEEEDVAHLLCLKMRQFSMFASAKAPMTSSDLQMLESLFLPEAKRRVVDFRRLGTDEGALPLLLECLSYLETLHSRFFKQDESVGEMKMQKKVSEWLSESAKTEFDAVLKRWTEHHERKLGGMANISRNEADRVISWGALIGACDDLMADVARIQKTVRLDCFLKFLSVDVVCLISHEYALKLFNHVVELCTDVAGRQNADGEILCPNDFSFSLEVYRDFCPKFVDALHFFQERSYVLYPQFKPYGLFYQMIVNAIAVTTSNRLSSLVASVIRRKDEEEPCLDTASCSSSCVSILDIVFGRLEIVYEIDFLIRESQGQCDCPKSLVFEYFEHSLPLLVDYVAHLKEQILQKFDVGSEKVRIYRLVANMEKVLSEFEANFQVKKKAEHDRDDEEEFRVSRALLELSSGGECMGEMDTPMNMPCFRKPFEEIRILRNEVAVKFSSSIYREHRYAIEQVLQSRNSQIASRRSRKSLTAVRASLVSLSDSLCLPFLSKVREFAYIMFVNLMIRRLLDLDCSGQANRLKWFEQWSGRKDPRTTCLNIEILLPRLFNLFSSDRCGVPEAILRHHQVRLMQISDLFKAQMTPALLQQLYLRMRNLEVPARDLGYYVSLTDLEEDDVRMIHPNDVERVIELLVGEER